MFMCFMYTYCSTLVYDEVVYYEFVGPDDAETFEMELSGFLREYGML